MILKDNFFIKLLQYLSNIMYIWYYDNMLYIETQQTKLAHRGPLRVRIHYTKKGEKVKSWGEMAIANLLFSQDIRYKYEPEITLDGHKIHPDFYLPDYNTYIEYWGGLGNKKYNFDMHLKKDTYEKTNTRILDVYPNNLCNLRNIFFARLNNKEFQL